MAKAEAKPLPSKEHDQNNLNVDDLVVGIVKSSWHPEIVDRLVDGAHRCGEQLGKLNIIEFGVPGCFELPLGCQALAEQEYVNAIVAIGVVVRGETVHFDLVSQGAAVGIQQVQLKTNIPIGLGVLAVENEQQAIERSQDDDENNAGYDAMYAALAMTNNTKEKIFNNVKKELEKRTN